MDYRSSHEYAQVIAAQMRAEIAAANVSKADLHARSGLTKTHRYLHQGAELSVPVFLALCAAIPIDPALLIARADERAQT